MAGGLVQQPSAGVDFIPQSGIYEFGYRIYKFGYWADLLIWTKTFRDIRK
jgi:hypothetical protein